MLPQDELKTIVSEVDANGDGEIDFAGGFKPTQTPLFTSIATAVPLHERRILRQRPKLMHFDPIPL